MAMSATTSKALRRIQSFASTTPVFLAAASRHSNKPRALHTGPLASQRQLASGRHRPQIDQHSRHLIPGLTLGRRTLFIQTENTPNPDALKFKPNSRILPEGFPTSFLEYLSPRSTLAPPHPSPLASQIINIDGVSSVFYGTDYITVTKDSAVQWGHVKPEVFSLITEAVTAGTPIVNTIEGKAGEGQSGAETDSLQYDENDSEVVSMIKELLETRIRPAIQEDGGDIEFRGFNDGWVSLKLRGACRTCDSSTVTLRNGIESMVS